MKGYLKKDFYLTLGYCRSIFLIVIVFTAIGCFQTGNYFFVYYPSVMVSMISVSLLSYDEREHFCAYAATMPQTRASYVSAKYLYELMFGAAFLVLSVAAHAICGNFSGAELLTLAATLGILVLLTSAITMPFMFRFGVEKGRMVYYVMIGVATVFAMLLPRSSLAGKLGEGTFFGGLCAITALIYAVSWRLSARFYSQREF